MALGVVVGTALCAGVSIAFDLTPCLVMAASFMALVVAKRWRLFLALACIAGLILGGWRGSGKQQALQGYLPLVGQIVEAYGQVHEDTSIGAKGDQRLRLSEVVINGSERLPGEAWVSTITPLEIKRGDKVTLSGRLEAGFGNLAASMYRAQLIKAERPYPGDIARRVRDLFADSIRRSIVEPQASLGIGYLTGQHSTLPATLNEQLRTVGLTHVVVASGYNLTILAAFARRLLIRFSKYLATLTAVVMISGFVLITGLSPSMSRAALVAALSLATWYYGRTIHPFVLLPFAAAVTVLINPSFAWGDIGWCLSFAAFIGVIVVAPIMRAYLWGTQTQPGTLWQLMIDTAAAQLVTLPIILFAFGSYASYALVANILVVPLVLLAMLLTCFAGVSGLLLPGFAHLAGWPAQVLLSYMLGIVHYVAELPGARGTVSFGLMALISSYVALILIFTGMWRLTTYRFRGNDMLQK